MTIMRLLPPHIEDVLTLNREEYAELPLAPLSEPRLRENALRCLTEGVVLASITADNVIAGICGLECDSPYFSEELWLVERFFFVRPAHRREPHARELLRAARAYAKLAQMPLQLGVASMGKRAAGKIRLFERELGEFSGAFWLVRD